MKYYKLNKNWSSITNNTKQIISTAEEGLQLDLLLNPEEYQHIDEGEKGILVFYDVYAYRTGNRDDEAFYKSVFKSKSGQLPLGDFYELNTSKRKAKFPDDSIVVDESINKKDVRYFVLFLNNEIFECLATDCQFSFIDTVSEELEEKYPKGYLNHYVSMFTSQFEKASVENYTMFTDLYIQMEGKNELAELKKEVKRIKSNNDLHSYVKFANYFQIENFGINQLKQMLKVIENYKLGKK